jgi:hypothetical protein
MTSSTTRLRRPERLRVTGTLLAVLAAGMWFVVLSAPGASAALRPHAAGVAATSATAGTSCPAGATCSTIPTDCPAGTTCPEVILTPTTGVGTNQSVFVSLENFPPNVKIYVYYCSDKIALAQADPLCMLHATPEIPQPQVDLFTSPEGSSSISFDTEEDTDYGYSPLTGFYPGESGAAPNFYCDDYANPCSIDITDPTLDAGGGFNLVLNPDNAVAVPISFAKPSGGCPNAAFVNSTSEWGIDRIFPIASEFDCVGKTPAIAVNTAFNSLQAVTAMVGGAAQLAFIDDPNAADVQAELAQLNVGGKPGYALIPVGLSAQVIGFRATMQGITSGQSYPQNTFSLTPAMVAGLVTNYYSAPEGADMTKCGKAFGGRCSLLAALNTIDGFRVAGEYGGYVRSDTSFSTSELFNWLCSAPKVPVELGGQLVKETETAATVLVTGLQAGGASVTSCPNTDQFPALSNTFAWVAGNTPSVQALKLSAFVPYGGSSTSAGFAPMNWSWANYYGLLPAALQNAYGNFVLPSATSLDAAVADATVNANGTLTPNFNDDKDPNEYPLPDIWYAVVPTTPQLYADAVAYRTMLEDVLNITGGSQSADLPAGFVPMPASMYTAALADVTNDIDVPPAPAPTTTSTTTTSTSTTTTTTTTVAPVTATTSPAATPTTSPNVPPSTSFNVRTTGASTATGTTSPKVPPTTRAFQTTAFSVFGHSEAWIAPTFVSVVALAMLLGPGLLLKTRRRSGGIV